VLVLIAMMSVADAKGKLYLRRVSYIYDKNS